MAKPSAGPNRADDASRERAVACARVLADQRLTEICVLQVDAALQITDFFVIATGASSRQLSRAADQVLATLRERGMRPVGKEGVAQGQWVLLDFGDVVLHLMREDMRRFYELEVLWGDCPCVPWEPNGM